MGLSEQPVGQQLLNTYVKFTSGIYLFSTGRDLTFSS